MFLVVNVEQNNTDSRAYLKGRNVDRAAAVTEPTGNTSLCDTP